jgi:hypothetical protein
MGRTGPTARDRARARLLDRSIRARLSRFLRRALTSDGPSWEAVTFAGILVGAALAWSIVANAVHVPVLASLAPYDPGDAINTLWQVHSAVVALSIPLLVLLLEQAQSKAVLATTTGHVLMSDCSAVATTVVSLGSVIELGVVAVYLPSDGALLANLILSAICVVLITRGYWNALGLLASPFRLRDRSRAVLFSRVKASVEESFEHALANDEVELQLHAWRPTLYPPPERAGWLPVLQADRAGSVEDVLIEPLRRALTGLVSTVSVGPLITDEDGDPTTGVSGARSDPPESQMFIMPVGSRVNRGDRLIAVQVESRDVPPAAFRDLVRLGPASRHEGTFRSELKALRDQILSAIDGSVLGDVEDGFTLYSELVQQVLSYRAEYSARTGHPAPVDWFNPDGREADWLQDDLQTFIDRAWRVESVEVLALVSSQLARLLDMLRRSGDSAAHRRVLQLATRFYYRSLSTERGKNDRHSAGRQMLQSIRSYAEFQVLFDFAASPNEQLEYLLQATDFLLGAAKHALDVDATRVPAALVEVRELIQGASLLRRDREPGGVEPAWAPFYDLVFGYQAALGGYTLLLHSKGKLSDQDAAIAVRAIRDLAKDEP